MVSRMSLHACKGGTQRTFGRRKCDGRPPAGDEQRRRRHKWQKGCGAITPIVFFLGIFSYYFPQRGRCSRQFLVGRLADRAERGTGRLRIQACADRGLVEAAALVQLGQQGLLTLRSEAGFQRGAPVFGQRLESGERVARRLV